MEIYDCRDCGQELPTRLEPRRGRQTFAEYRQVVMSCQNPDCPRCGKPIVAGQAVPRA